MPSLCPHLTEVGRLLHSHWSIIEILRSDWLNLTPRVRQVLHLHSKNLKANKSKDIKCVPDRESFTIYEWTSRGSWYYIFDICEEVVRLLRIFHLTILKRPLLSSRLLRQFSQDITSLFTINQHFYVASQLSVV